MTIKIYNGQLKIDLDNGTIDFESNGSRLLRVTHLPTPIPQGVGVDIVAIRNVTSYAPLQEPGRQAPDLAPMLTETERKQSALEASRHVESFQEWIDKDIEPVKELGPE